MKNTWLQNVVKMCLTIGTLLILFACASQDEMRIDYEIDPEAVVDEIKALKQFEEVEINGVTITSNKGATNPVLIAPWCFAQNHQIRAFNPITDNGVACAMF